MRAATLGRATEEDWAVLRRLGLLTDKGELNAEGRRLYDAAWVYDEADQVRIVHRDVLLTLPATQALMQGLHGRGSVSVSGALHVLARHGLADVDDPGRLRAFLGALNQTDILAWQVMTRMLVPGPRLPSCPSIDDIDVDQKSLRRQSHISISAKQGRTAERLIARAAERTGSLGGCYEGPPPPPGFEPGQ